MLFENIRSRQRERVVQGGTRTVTRVLPVRSPNMYKYACTWVCIQRAIINKCLINDLWNSFWVVFVMKSWYFIQTGSIVKKKWKGGDSPKNSLHAKLLLNNSKIVNRGGSLKLKFFSVYFLPFTSIFLHTLKMFGATLFLFISLYAN